MGWELGLGSTEGECYDLTCKLLEIQVANRCLLIEDALLRHICVFERSSSF